MRSFTFITRLGFVFFDFMLISVTVASFYFGVNWIYMYFSYPDSIVFSTYTIFFVLFFMISIPILFLSFSPICIGFQASIKFQRKTVKFIWISFIFIIILSLMFDFYYLGALSNKGYIKCQGIPSGSMPGMATKYVTNEALCSKKDP